MSQTDLSRLFAEHIATRQREAEAALAASGLDHLLIAAGVDKYRFHDDMPYPFRPNPQFLAWAPLDHHPRCWLAVTPGKKPVLVYYQPDDFWHLVPADPNGYWVDAFDIRIVRRKDDIAAELPPAAKAAILGEADAAIDGYAPNNPDAVVNPLHYARGVKTAYELVMMRRAQQRAVAGHRAAEAAFRAHESELGIQRAYLAASGHLDTDLPYGNIIGLNEHGAVLHYQHQDAMAPSDSRSFLIDAGAQVVGYAADITRTYARSVGPFQDLIDGIDAVQRRLCDAVRAGTDYAQLHLDCHRQLAQVLIEQDVLHGSADDAVASGVSSTFFPHGLGHLIGLQVHDIGGFMPGPDGGRIEPPEGHPFLRLTRKLEPGMVVTIEPGLYFIDSLLAKLKEGPHADMVNWKRVDTLRPYGGVRIEDEVLCTDGEPENLSRAAFAAAG
ncbi:MAG: Xaa-Pro dipeptidase [Lysobacteraceae bacterium]